MTYAITVNSGISLGMDFRILLLAVSLSCTLCGIVASTNDVATHTSDLRPTSLQMESMTNNVTENIQDFKGPITSQSFIAPTPFHPTTSMPLLKTSSPWDHIRKYFTDFASEVIALNSEFCGRTCNFSHTLKADINGFCDDCSCSENCQQTGDCCPDLVLLRNQTYQTYPGCIEDRLPAIGAMYYLMVNWCPDSYNLTHLKTACEEPSYTNWSSVVPHFNVESGASFRNIYCAQCHGQNNTRSWTTSIACSSFDNTIQEATSLLELFNATLNSKVCYIHWEPPYSVYRYLQSCGKRKVDEVIDHCNMTGRWKHYDKNVAGACSMFSHVVFGTYRNIFCFMCNTDISWYQILQMQISDRDGIMMLPLTALIDFDNTLEYKHRSYSKTTDSWSNINNNGSMITYLKECHNISVSCAEGKQLDKDQCHSLFSSSNMYGYRVCFQINITITNPLTSSLDLNELAEKHFPRLNYRVIELANVTSYVVEIQNCLHKKMYAVMRYIIFVYSLNILNRDEFEQELMGDEIILTNSSVHVQYQGGCNSTPTQPLTRGDEYHCSTQFHKFVFPKTIPVEFIGTKIYEQARYIQLSKQIICPRVVLDSSKYIIHHHDSMFNVGENKISKFSVLTLLSTQTILKDGDFQDLGNGSVAICVSDYVNATSQASILCNDQHGVTSTFLGIFSFVCTSVSLLFLALTFITYCLFVSMRTIGGMCNMGLVFTLFSAQIVLEFGMEQNQDVIGCQVIGICIHFLWLAAVFWMNACTFLLFLKLSFPLKSRNFGHNVTKIFFLSALYANGTSALIVSLNIIVNIATRGDIGYGGNICYLNTYFSQIYFFKIPIGIIVIVNIGLFIFTVCRIRRNVSVSSTRESKINLFSCVKLSVITGLVWLSSYLYEIFHITAFAYIFTLLVGAQGVLFFFAIVINRNVMSLWTSFFVRMKNGVVKGHTHSDVSTSSENITRHSNISHSDSYELTIRRSKSRV